MIYFLMSLLTGRYNIFAGLSACILFNLPVIIAQKGSSFAEMIKLSLFLGIPGVLLSIIFMAATGSYSTKTWLISAVTGFTLCLGYIVLCQNITGKKNVIAKCAVLMTATLFCFF